MHINSKRNGEQRIKHRVLRERFPDVSLGRGFEIKCLPERLEIVSRLKRALSSSTRHETKLLMCVL